MIASSSAVQLWRCSRFGFGWRGAAAAAAPTAASAPPPPSAARPAPARAPSGCAPRRRSGREYRRDRAPLRPLRLDEVADRLVLPLLLCPCGCRRRRRRRRRSSAAAGGWSGSGGRPTASRRRRLDLRLEVGEEEVEVGRERRRLVAQHVERAVERAVVERRQLGSDLAQHRIHAGVEVRHARAPVGGSITPCCSAISPSIAVAAVSAIRQAFLRAAQSPCAAPTRSPTCRRRTPRRIPRERRRRTSLCTPMRCSHVDAIHFAHVASDLELPTTIPKMRRRPPLEITPPPPPLRRPTCSPRPGGGADRREGERDRG